MAAPGPTCSTKTDSGCSISVARTHSPVIVKASRISLSLSLSLSLSFFFFFFFKHLDEHTHGEG